MHGQAGRSTAWTPSSTRLVLSPALTELLPKSGIKVTPANVSYAGSILFGLFLLGWGLSIIWGSHRRSLRPQPRRHRRHDLRLCNLHRRSRLVPDRLATGSLSPAHAGIGIGGEWALAAHHYVAEAWPEDTAARWVEQAICRTGYYSRLLPSPPLSTTLRSCARYGWRAMFWVRPHSRRGSIRRTLPRKRTSNARWQRNCTEAPHQQPASPPRSSHHPTHNAPSSTPSCSPPPSAASGPQPSTPPPPSSTWPSAAGMTQPEASPHLLAGHGPSLLRHHPRLPRSTTASRAPGPQARHSPSTS